MRNTAKGLKKVVCVLKDWKTTNKKGSLDARKKCYKIINDILLQVFVRLLHVFLAELKFGDDFEVSFVKLN